MKKNNLIVFLLFLLFLFLPAAVALVGGNADSLFVLMKDQSDNNAEKQKIFSQNRIFKAVVPFYANTLYRLGISHNPDISVYGKDGWLFLGNNYNESFNQMVNFADTNKKEYSRKWADTIAKYEESITPVPLVFIVVPEKWSVNPGKMPTHAQRFKNEPHLFDYLLDYGKDLPIVNLMEKLAEASSESPAYSPLDSHWTEFGAYRGWQIIAEEIKNKIGVDQKIFGEAALKEILSLYSASEVESILNLSVKDFRPAISLEEPFHKFKVFTAEGREFFYGQEELSMYLYPMRTENKGAAIQKRALVFADSQGNYLIPYFASAFSEVYFERHHFSKTENFRGIAEIVKEKRADIVFYEMAERLLIFDLKNPMEDAVKVLKDLSAIKAALAEYFKANKAYPVSSGFDRLYHTHGRINKNWIKDLAPKYIDNLPRDPRNDRSHLHQYMYMSDGKDYKLLSLNMVFFEEIIRRFPELADPKRSDYAIGFYTEGARDW